MLWKSRQLWIVDKMVEVIEKVSRNKNSELEEILGNTYPPKIRKNIQQGRLVKHSTGQAA